MKKFVSKIAFSVFAFSVLALSSFAQFEGSIEFKRTNSVDTTKYVFYVKGTKVRLDEIGSKSKQVSGTSLIDLSGEQTTFKALNPERKLWMEKKPGSPVAAMGTPEITSTKASKLLLGVNCKEVVVNNKTENTTIKYYIGGSGFDFFVKFLKFMNRKDKSAIYYLLLKGNAGDGFPYLSIQTDNTTGKEVERLEVLKIEKKILDPVLFEAPKEYKKFEMN